MIRSALMLWLIVATAACSSKPVLVAAANRTDWRKPGDVIDSILPMPEYLRRFRIGVDSPPALSGESTTREALTMSFLGALSRGDTATLAALAVSRAEFAWLLFPDHRYAATPYELDPALFWRQITGSNAKGISRALQRHRGVPLALVDLACQRDTLQFRRGPTRLWGPCRVTYRAADSTITRQLFGSIVERGGRMKFLSYASDF